MKEADSFLAVAPYYDELMKGVPYRMWVGYYLLLLSQMDAHPKRLLDVCCGTGTMTEMLAREGFEMAGFDVSRPMVERAREKAAKKHLEIRYEVADARTVEMKDTYDGALSFFDSLNNILKPEGLLAAFERVFAHLRPGGTFVFDLNTAYAFEQKMFDQKDLRQSTRLRYKWKGDYDRSTRIIEVDMRFWYQEQQFQEIHRQRAYDLDEVVPLLQQAGFTQIRAFESYTLEKPRQRSDRLHYTAFRP